MTIEGKVRESDWKVPHSQGEDASSGPHRGCWLSLEAGQGKEVSPPPPRASRRPRPLGKARVVQAGGRPDTGPGRGGGGGLG